MKTIIQNLLAALALLVLSSFISTASAQTIQPIYSFPSSTNITGPLPSSLALGPDGNFYGTTQNGGDFGNGSVFKVTASGAFSTLYPFTTDLEGTNSDGANPYAALTLGPDGNFYGTTYAGGSSGDGTVFKVTTNGVLTTLVSFTSSNGANSRAPLLFGPDGNFYGTTVNGGSSGNGTVFQVTTNGALTTLYSFSATTYNDGTLTYVNSDGANPYAGLTLGPDGNFYGTTFEGGDGGHGTVFQVTTNGVLTTLVTFGILNGSGPYAGLTLGPDGNFYGTTWGGGFNFGGTVFQLTTNGVFTLLYSFSGNDGLNPEAALTLGPDGNFYGTTENGGSRGGTVFEVTTNGVLTSLASFDITNGEWPYAGLTLGPDGSLYGTTSAGGTNGIGVVYLMNISPPKIIDGPSSESVPLGDKAAFQVSVTGALPLSYQWYFNTNTVQPAGTNASIAIRPALTNSDGYYQVVVTNFFASVTSDVASLTVTVEPNMWGISKNPAGGTTTLSLASYPGSTNFVYATTNLALPLWQWQLIGTNVAASDGLFQFVDPNTQGVPAKFYRLSDELIAP